MSVHMVTVQMLNVSPRYRDVDASRYRDVSERFAGEWRQPFAARAHRVLRGAADMSG